MKENGKKEINENISIKNLKPSFNKSKISSNISYKENTQLNFIKGKIDNNFFNGGSSDNSFDNIDENPNQVVSKILDSINKNSLSSFYDPDSEFKKKIDSLNLKFYLETEKYLCNQNKKIKTQTSLFIILFKQIIIYIKEIERLNLIILQKKYKPENIIKRTDNIAQKQKEFQTKEDIINALKKSQSNMETKLLQSFINENNLNQKIDNLQKEIEFYKKKLISMNNNGEIHMIKLDRILINNSQNDKKENVPNTNFNKKNNNNIIKTKKKKNSHNSICFTNSSKHRINNIIKINKPINIKSKSPSNYNAKISSFKLKNIKSVNINTKRNLSETDEIKKISNNNNNNKNNNQINEIKYVGNSTINDSQNMNPKKTKLEKIEKNSNTIDINENCDDLNNRNAFKKIFINSKTKLNKEDNISFRNNKKNSNNMDLNLILLNSNLPNNSNVKKQKDFNMIKCAYTCYNTISNYSSKYRSENAFNYFKLVKNDKKMKIESNKSQYNNLNRVINRNVINEQKSKSLLKKEKNHKNKIKNIINLSGPALIRKDNNTNQNKKS